MGRKKSDSPISFPWEKLFSESDNEFDQAITYCSSEHIGSDTVKKAVTTVVSGYNSGSKTALCSKIKDKANHIRQQILKSEDVESTRNSVIDFYKNTFLKKFEGKFEGINNIVIPARPILPELSSEERKIYGSPPSSPRRKPVVLDEEDIPEIDLGSLDEPESGALGPEPSFDKVLEAQAILYASTKADKNGIVTSINAKEFYGMLTDTYQETQAEEFMLNKDNVKRAINNLAAMLKANKNKVKGVSDAKKIVGSLSLKKELKPVPPPAPVPSPKYEVPVSPKNVEAEIRSGAITEEEIIAYIKSKGWSVPSSKSKEKLCDYVLSKIAKEDKVQDKKYEELLGKVEELTTNLFTLIDMHEERIKKLEKIKKKRKVSFAEKDEIKIIEEEKKEIEEQITEVKDQLEDATKQKEKLDTEKETKKHLCFKMKNWLDEDDFDRVEAEKDLSCGSAGICNIDKGECETSVSSSDYSATIGSASIKGSKNVVDKIKGKFEKKKVVIDEEEIVPEPKKKPVVIDEEEKIPDIESEPEEEPEGEEVETNLEYTFKGGEYIKFYSNATSPYNKLSNFYHIKEGIEIDGITYPSSEHAFQAQKYILSDRQRFSIDGDLGKVEPGFTLVFPELKDKEKVEKKKKHWMKKENIGIIAKKATSMKVGQKLKLTRLDNFISTDDLWIKILSKKFNIPELRDILVGTGSIYLLEFDKSAKRNADEGKIVKWGGLIQDDILYGKNVMGIYLMKIRDIINSGEEVVEEAVEEPVEEEIPDISSDVELSEDEEPVPVKPLQKCNTIPLDEDVDDETRAKDLSCGEGKVCNLDMSMCVVEGDVKDPIEEMTIGGMLIKVVGSNAILNKLKEKIMKSGGEIPAEPVAEEEPQAEEPAEDAFKSLVPGVRPTLESIIQGIKSISKSTTIVSEQSKIKAANRKCLERIAKCAGINI